MNAAKDTDFLPLARRIAADESVFLSDAQLLSVISGSNGSFRCVTSIVRLAKKTKRQAEEAANIVAASIQRAAKK
jgi:hypothetical protein